MAPVLTVVAGSKRFFPWQIRDFIMDISIPFKDPGGGSEKFVLLHLFKLCKLTFFFPCPEGGTFLKCQLITGNMFRLELQASL